MTVQDLLDRLRDGLKQGEIRPDTEVEVVTRDDEGDESSSPARFINVAAWGGHKLVIR